MSKILKKIGIIQSRSLPGAFPDNLRQIVQGYRECLDHGADIVIAPLTALSGPATDDLKRRRSFLRQMEEAAELYLSLGKYDLLIVSPATANTVSKIVYGIADTLVTNAVAQAGKGAVPVYMVPVDIHPGPIDTVLPSKMELSKCEGCDDCVAALVCEQGAIIPHSEIDLTKCIGCGLCRNSCPNGAISEGKIITIYMRDIDIENTRKLTSIDNIQIFENPEEILDKI